MGFENVTATHRVLPVKSVRLPPLVTPRIAQESGCCPALADSVVSMFEPD